MTLVLTLKHFSISSLIPLPAMVTKKKSSEYWLQNTAQCLHFGRTEQQNSVQISVVMAEVCELPLEDFRITRILWFGTWSNLKSADISLHWLNCNKFWCYVLNCINNFKFGLLFYHVLNCSHNFKFGLLFYHQGNLLRGIVNWSSAVWSIVFC